MASNVTYITSATAKPHTIARCCIRHRTQRSLSLSFVPISLKMHIDKRGVQKKKKKKIGESQDIPGSTCYIISPYVDVHDYNKICDAIYNTCNELKHII